MEHSRQSDLCADWIGEISGLCTADSQIVFDYPDETTLSGSGAERVHTLAEITEKLGEKMLHGYSFREISETLERYSYEIEDHETPQMIERQYFENRTDGITAFENIHFILADRRESV